MRPLVVVRPPVAGHRPGSRLVDPAPVEAPVKKLLILVVVLALGAFAAKKLLED